MNKKISLMEIAEEAERETTEFKHEYHSNGKFRQAIKDNAHLLLAGRITDDEYYSRIQATRKQA